MNKGTRHGAYLLPGSVILLIVLLAYPDASRSHAKPYSSAPTAEARDVPKTTNFKPAPDGLKTFEWVTAWQGGGAPGFACNSFAALIDTGPYLNPGAGQITAGFLHHWDGGHGPFPCQERSTAELVGTVWFDLSEIFSKPAFPKAESA